MPGLGLGWLISAVRNLLLMLLQPHSSPRSGDGLRASGREEVTLTNKQGGGWCAPRQRVKGVPGGSSRDLWPRRHGALSTVFGSCLLAVLSPGCYTGMGLQGKTSPVHHSCDTRLLMAFPGEPQGADATGIQPSWRAREMLL